jgi:hypothetical protein
MLELEGRPLAVIYCDDDKRPMGEHGWYSASLVIGEASFFRKGPNIGIPTGRINNIIVVDIDPRHGGDRTFTEQLSWLPPTLTHRSRSGGQHLIYRYPPQGIPNLAGTAKNGLPGIDVLSNGKGAVWPPSPGYTVIDPRPIADCPARLVELVQALTSAPRRSEGRNDAPLMDWRPSANGELPRELYLKVCKLMKGSRRHDQRRVIGLLRELVETQKGRNKVLFDKAAAFRKPGGPIEDGIIEDLKVADLLYLAMRINGYTSKPNGKYRAESTIRSALGLSPDQWPISAASSL